MFWLPVCLGRNQDLHVYHDPVVQSKDPSCSDHRKHYKLLNLGIHLLVWKIKQKDMLLKL